MNVPFMSRNKVTQTTTSFTKSHKSSVQANFNNAPFSPLSSQNEAFRISLQNFPVSPTGHDDITMGRTGNLVSQEQPKRST